MKKTKLQRLKEQREKKTYAIIRGFITIVFVALFIFMGIKVAPIIMNMSTEEGRTEFAKKVSEMGVKGPIYILFIQVIQMIVAVIPGEPIEMMASMCFGFTKGILLCLTGFFIGSFIIFNIVRNVGMGFIRLFFSDEKINEIKGKKYFKHPAEFEAALFIIFIIPGIPKDIFLYVAGLTPVKMSRFLLLSTFARLPALVISNVAGQRISQGKIHEAVILYVATLIFGLAAVYINNRRDKKKTEKENSEKKTTIK